METVVRVALLATIAGALGWPSAACATRDGGPPAITIDRSVCSHCGMLISEPVYAAALRTPDGHERVFDDIGCLLAALRSWPDWKAGSLDPALRLWFHDADTGEWIDGPAAVFVVSTSLRTPMGGGIVAHKDRDAAARAARAHDGAVVASVAELLARKGLVP
jgi:copper chaperone NosL